MTLPEPTLEKKSEALVILAGNEGNIAKSSRELDITAHYLKKIRDQNPEMYEAARKAVADDIFDKTLIMADKYGDELLRRIDTPDELKKLKIRDLAVVMGIAIDKVNVMSVVKGKFGETQQAAKDFSLLSEEELAEVIEAEFNEISDEAQDGKDMPGASEDGLHAKERRVPPVGDVLHRRERAAT